MGLNQRCRQTKPLAGPYTPDTLPKGAYDVIIVGAGQQPAVGVAAATAAAAAACCLPPLASRGSLPSPATPHPLHRFPGPSGSVAAYYLAKGGARVALLDKVRASFCRWPGAASACPQP